ncbi:signal protein [Escherichia coli]|nr:signal protein [Escherichia coli]
MVAGSLIFLFIILLTFFWKKAELVNDSQIRVNFALGYIENILNQNNSISPEAEHLLLNNCNADTQRELSNLLLKRPQLRALSPAKQEAVFCSTHPGLPVGPVAEKERWRHDMLIRFPEDTGTLPRILLKTPYKNGTVITATDYYFIQDIISVVHAVPAIQFRLGNTVLSASGKMSLCSRTTAAYKKKVIQKISVLPDLYHPGENATYLRPETGSVYVPCCHLRWNTHSLSAVPTSSIFPA